MKEEEVDQYFKDKFNQFAPVPAADAWARLQSKMEPPRQKRSPMWVYYAAAVITLTLVSGVLLFWLKTNPAIESENLARLQPITTPLRVDTTIETKIADAVINTPPSLPTIEKPLDEKNVKTGTSNSSTTSKPVKKGRKIRPGILVAVTKPLPLTKPRESNTAAQPQPEDLPTVVSNSSNSADVPTLPDGKVMEVTIKKDPVATVAYSNDAEDQTAREVVKENLSKKGRLVKNIFKQARNLKNGEKVELSTLGLNANYRIDVESKLFKQKYTKVINL